MRSPFLLPSLSPGAHTHTHEEEETSTFPPSKKGGGGGGPHVEEERKSRLFSFLLVKREEEREEGGRERRRGRRTWFGLPELKEGGGKLQDHWHRLLAWLAFSRVGGGGKEGDTEAEREKGGRRKRRLEGRRRESKS